MRLRCPPLVCFALLTSWVVPLSACSDTDLGQPCVADSQCSDLHRDAVCYDDGVDSFCTIVCDIAESVCTEMVGDTCVAMETVYRPETFANDKCERLGGECVLSGERTVCR